MRLRTRLVLALTFAFATASILYGYWVRDILRNGYRESVEEMMVDTSQLLASAVPVGEDGRPDVNRLKGTIESFKARRFDAMIHGFRKLNPGLDVYVTDREGKALYSSISPDDTGKDFSRWNDVRRTLDGKYGARRTRSNPEDEFSVFYVAAPILQNGRIAGSLTVAKQRNQVAEIVTGAISKALLLGLAVVTLALVFSVLASFWITKPLLALRDYALGIASGSPAAFAQLKPKLHAREVRELGMAFEEMRIALEKKKEIESFVQALSHEMKSPLTAIQGAAELLAEPMAEKDRQRFLASVLQESKRASELMERLLELAAMEAGSFVRKSERISIPSLLESIREELLGISAPREVKITIAGAASSAVMGDAFLLQQALRNLLQNAVEFSPPGSEVRAWIEEGSKGIAVIIEDDGIGIPPGSQEQIFMKFYSTERPATGRKGTGLGLAFCREAVALHGGTISVASPVRDSRGSRFTVTLPS